MIFPGSPSAAPDHHSRGVLFRIMLEETQKAPSRIAPTKINAANTASTLSFIVTSTRRTSITVAQRNLAETGAALKRVDCCSAAKLDARHSHPSRRQVHEIGKHFRASKKVPPAARKIFCAGAQPKHDRYAANAASAKISTITPHLRDACSVARCAIEHRVSPHQPRSPLATDKLAAKVRGASAVVCGVTERKTAVAFMVNAFFRCRSAISLNSP